MKKSIVPCYSISGHGQTPLIISYLYTHPQGASATAVGRPLRGFQRGTPLAQAGVFSEVQRSVKKRHSELRHLSKRPKAPPANAALPSPGTHPAADITEDEKRAGPARYRRPKTQNIIGRGSPSRQGGRPLLPMSEKRQCPVFCVSLLISYFV